MSDNRMQLNIKSSNSLDLLVEELVKQMRTTTKPDAGSMFSPIYLVTQTDGMQAWLKMQIAEKAGIAANLVFMKPNELINFIFKETGGRYENTLSVADIQWLIYKSLNNEVILQKYPSLANYFMHNGKTDNIKRIGLSQKLADLFDQYEVYREGMLKSWATEKLTTDTIEERWQMDIWNTIKAGGGKKFPDKSRIKDIILQNLNDDNSVYKLRSKIPAVYFFGTSLVTSFHFEILQSVARYIPITFYLPNPAPHLYWYDDKSKKTLFYQRKRGVPDNEISITNPLLINWGKLVQNTFRLLFSSDEVINLYEDIEHHYGRKSLLSSVQHLIHENTIASSDELFSLEMLNDKSITIKSCFSVAREVEALYNFLVKLIDDNPGKYAPRDIVVHVTNINRYASYIRAVFDNAPYSLRYSIADESFTATDTTSQALYEILTLEESDFTSEKVTQLLNFSAIRNHFGIKDIGAIRKVVADANIRHGIDGDVHSDSVYVSWTYGLKRIMYGICINTEEEYEPGDNGFFPLNSIEGNVANEVIHFVYFIEKLIYFLKCRVEDRTVTQWITYIHEVIRYLIYYEEEKDNPEYHQLTEHINSLEVADELFNEPVSYQVFLRQFLPGLSEMTKSYRFARGGVTFCSLIPMRSIPFRIVAMLGLDFDKFPREPTVTGFDLMHKYPQPGDRNIRINDKHLFLETLMSAGEYLYLSFIGQQIKDNSKLPPSILIDELVSFIESSSQQPDLVRNILLREEPLHGFSTKYGHEPGYYNYLLGAARPLSFEHETEKEIGKMDTLDIMDFRKFLSNSVEYYYQKTIGIYFDNEPVVLPEIEMFELDSLQRWSLKNSLLLESEDDVHSFIDFQKKVGRLPLKSAGEYEVTTAIDEMGKVKLVFDELREGLLPASETIEIEIDQVRISATINFIFGKKVLIPCFSKNENKYYLQAWLTELILAVTGKEYEVVFIGREKKPAMRIDHKVALSILRQLIRLLKEAQHQAFPFNIQWFPFEKQPDKNQLEQKIANESEKDNYLGLAIRDGFRENVLELYEKIAGVVVPSIIQTFKEA